MCREIEEGRLRIRWKGGNKIDSIIVPQSDINRLEIARKRLFEIVGDNPIVISLSFEVSDAMYHITHRKYEKVL